MNKITLCVPTFNSSQFIIKSIQNVIDDERISQIIINDDCSDDFDQLFLNLKSLKSSKIEIISNEINLKAFKNKYECVKRATNDWIILLDSDNIIDKEYLDIIYQQKWDIKTILCPELALPNFKFTRFVQHSTIGSANSDLFHLFQYDALLNTGNYFFNRKEYITKYNDFQFDPYLTIGLDVIYFNTQWILNGNYLKVVKDLKYQHTVRRNGFYTINSKNGQNNRRNSIIIKSFLDVLNLINKTDIEI